MAKRITDITPQEAKAERAARELARRRFMPFCTYVAPWYQPARHHLLVGEYLERVEQFIASKGKEGIGRLIILMPPRSGKTEEAARLFPAWVLGKLPDSRVIVTSYGADLAQDDSKAIRGYVVSERYSSIFGGKSTVDEPVSLSDDSRSKANWDLGEPHRGGVVAAGIGGAITGRGAHLLVVDDPFKSREDAESESYRRRVHEWYKSVGYQRLEQGGAIVIMHTRWHPDDLAGVLMKQMVGDPLADQWTVVNLPALAYEESEYPTNDEQFKENLLRGIYIPYADPLGRQPGEALWPEKFNAEDLARKRANTDDLEFASLDQQLPRPMSGGFFDEENIQIMEKAPDELTWYAYIDLALGESQRSDFNAVMPLTLEPEKGDIVCRDLLQVRNLDDFLRQVEAMMLDERNHLVIWGVEDVAFQSLVFKEFSRNPKLAAVAIRRVKPNGDKVTRARPAQMRAREGHLKFVRGPWNLQAKRQLVAFPNGKNDDIVDTLSGGMQMIAEIAGKAKREAKCYAG
jgi:phage terminase large subunit-like protein